MGVALHRFGISIVDVGFKVRIPNGYYGSIVGKSGNAEKFRVIPGTVDLDYRGWVSVKVVADENGYIEVGTAVAQMVLVRVGLPMKVVCCSDDGRDLKRTMVWRGTSQRGEATKRLKKEDGPPSISDSSDDGEVAEEDKDDGDKEGDDVLQQSQLPAGEDVEEGEEVDAVVGSGVVTKALL